MNILFIDSSGDPYERDRIQIQVLLLLREGNVHKLAREIVSKIEILHNKLHIRSLKILNDLLKGKRRWSYGEFKTNLVEAVRYSLSLRRKTGKETIILQELVLNIVKKLVMEEKSSIICIVGNVESKVKELIKILKDRLEEEILLIIPEPEYDLEQLDKLRRIIEYLEDNLQNIVEVLQSDSNKVQKKKSNISIILAWVNLIAWLIYELYNRTLFKGPYRPDQAKQGIKLPQETVRELLTMITTV